MQSFISTLLIGVPLYLLSVIAAAEETGRQVMQSVFDQNRTYTTQKFDVLLTIKDKENRERKRNFTLWKKYYPQESKNLIRFYLPANLKGTSLLSVAEDAAEEVHQWIFLPALKSTRKLSSEEKGQSFMGSDFSNSDVGGRDIDTDTHKKTAEDEKYFYVTSFPKSKNDPYSKIEYKIHKRIRVVIEAVFYNKKGKKMKVLKNKKIKKHKDMYVVVDSLMSNLLTQGSTTLTVNNIETELGINDNFFFVSSLRQ